VQVPPHLRLVGPCGFDLAKEYDGIGLQGKQRLLPLAQARSFNVYTQKELVLAVGDSVRIQVIVSVFRIWKPGNPQAFI
jgi:hypothetical protein